MTEEKKPKRYFTEVEQQMIAELDPVIQEILYRKLADITMRIRISEDRWEQERNQIDEDLDVLIGEIHDQLAKL
ncbi:MAG: hypothetical protein M0Q91_14720 [Methanoregula sp.]|nr:hypothetical protein [Methanoregula sp.]